MNLNKIQIIGRVGQIDQLRFTKSDTPVIGLSVATSREYKGDEETTWHNVTVFGKTAEAICEYVEVGQELYVEGRLERDEWTDDNGVNRRSVSIVARDVQFGRRAGGSDSQPPAEESRGGSFNDDDIPF